MTREKFFIAVIISFVFRCAACACEVHTVYEKLVMKCDGGKSKLEMHVKVSSTFGSNYSLSSRNPINESLNIGQAQ
jgi:hypothetical protein